jgi:hypothetical protein
MHYFLKFFTEMIFITLITSLVIYGCESDDDNSSDTSYSTVEEMCEGEGTNDCFAPEWTVDDCIGWFETESNCTNMDTYIECLLPCPHGNDGCQEEECEDNCYNDHCSSGTNG